MFESVKKAFDRQSEVFDDYEEHNDILKWIRSNTRKHLLRHLKNGDKILELNAGTGIDAVFFAGIGHTVHAIDISEGMINKLKVKVEFLKLQEVITSEILSFTELDKLQPQTFDYIFSNFGGLNCVDDLKKVTKHFYKLLKPGGRVSLVIMPPVCPWEIVLAFKGKFKQAFRRLNKNGVLANIEGIGFKTYYYSLKMLIKALGQDFKMIEVQGLASLSPPPYADYFSKQHPHMYRQLIFADKVLSHKFPFNRCADHFIATFEFKKTNMQK